MRKRRYILTDTRQDNLKIRKNRRIVFKIEKITNRLSKLT